MSITGLPEPKPAVQPMNGDLWLVLKYDINSWSTDRSLDAVDAVVCATKEIAQSYQQEWEGQGHETDIDLVRVRA
jgi:hypothetical protein